MSKHTRDEAAPKTMLCTDAIDFVPFSDFVLIELIKHDPASTIGLLVPEHLQESVFPRWLVTDVGPGRIRPSDGQRNPMTLKPGDEVILGESMGRKFEVQGRTIKTFLCEESAIIAYVRHPSPVVT